MKKFILPLLSLLLFSFSFAYEPTAKDISDLNNLTGQLDVLVSWENIDLWWYYNQVVNLQNDYVGDERLNYMLWKIKDFLYNKISIQKTKEKVSSKSEKQEFLDLYNTGYASGVNDMMEKCVWWYNTLDDMSFSYNFPTALTIAVWYRETSCAYYLPNNWDWPFQIKSMDYWTGEITQKQFVWTVKDFLEFSKKKLDRYDGELSWNLSYNNFDMTWIVNFAALYNWWTKSWNIVLPNNMKYTYDWYGEEYSGSARFWIVAETLRVLDWELKNKY